LTRIKIEKINKRLPVAPKIIRGQCRQSKSFKLQSGAQPGFC